MLSFRSSSSRRISITSMVMSNNPTIHPTHPDAKTIRAQATPPPPAQSPQYQDHRQKKLLLSPHELHRHPPSLQIMQRIRHRPHITIPPLTSHCHT
mmetsp:Transcript_1020/g.1995  ORF Transcript_1020/g.1995 Transcript_1020/m.1995 type:complete len:96 (+) Transcript_1020:232-519(+)